MYGGTFRLFDQVVKHYGVAFSYVDTSDLSAVEAAWKPATKLLSTQGESVGLLAERLNIDRVGEDTHALGERAALETSGAI